MLATSKVVFHFFEKQTHRTFRKLVELVLFVLSFSQNYDLLKYYTINLKNIVKTGHFRLKLAKITAISSGSASAKKQIDVLI